MDTALPRLCSFCRCSNRFALQVNCLIPGDCLIREYTNVSKIQVDLGRNNQLEGVDHPSRNTEPGERRAGGYSVRTKEQGAMREEGFE